MKIGVFCSSKLDFSPSTIEACRAVAQWMAQAQHTLVYGGARVGIMGLLADELIKGGGQAEGYIPRHLFTEEVPHFGLTRLVEVQDLFERKRLMMDESDAFLILPGGIGTLDEFFEVLTWKSLHCFDKPIVVLNIDGFWDSLMTLMKDLKAKKVLDANVDNCFQVCSSVEEARRILC